MKTNECDATFASTVTGPIPLSGTRRRNAHAPGSTEAESSRAAKSTISSDPLEVD